MSDKNEPKEVHQPDDVLFKELMSIPENVKGYMQILTPEFAEMTDLSSLQLCSESFISPDLKTFAADVVWRCKLKESEEEVYVTFLCENKSEPETHVAIQVGLYLMLAYHKMAKEKGRKLEPIIPLIFYNGKQNWQPKTIDDLFRKHPLFKTIQPYLPSFRFHFNSIGQIPRKELLSIERSFLRSVLLAMANKHDIFWLEQNISIIFDFDDWDESLSVSFSRYIFGIIERLPEELKNSAKNLKKEVSMKVNSTLYLLIEEGKEIGKEEGEAIGIEKGEKFMALMKDIDSILYFTIEVPDFPLEKITSLTKRSKDFILKTQKAYSKGNERTARKYMKELLAKFEPIKDSQRKKVEDLFDKYLPKFRKNK